MTSDKIDDPYVKLTAQEELGELESSTEAIASRAMFLDVLAQQEPNR